MKLFTTDLFVLPLPPGHRFPMIRYRLLRERLQQCGLFQPDDFEVPPAASEQQLQLVHTADWVRRVLSGELTGDEIRRIGFPWSLQMVERCRRSTGATVAAESPGGTHGRPAEKPFGDVQLPRSCTETRNGPGNAPMTVTNIRTPPSAAEKLAEPRTRLPAIGLNGAR